MGKRARPVPHHPAVVKCAICSKGIAKAKDLVIARGRIMHARCFSGGGNGAGALRR